MIIWHLLLTLTRLFLNPATGKQIEASNFVISVHQGVLTAEADGNPKIRVPLFQLSLDPRHDSRGTALRADQRDRRHPHRNRASALDTTFGTTLFTPGLGIGTASTLLQF